MSNLNINLDILDQDIPERRFELFGQAFVSVKKVALVKGVGKVEYDPSVHKGSPVHAIDLTIVPLANSSAREANRNMIQSSTEWRKTKESIEATGTKPSMIDKRYVKVTFQPTGETYIDRNGEEKNKTYIHFEKFYADENACLEEAYFKSPEESAADGQTQANDDGGKAVAEQLLSSMIRNSAKPGKGLGDLIVEMRTKIAQSPVVSAHFSVDDPKVIDMIQKEIASA